VIICGIVNCGCRHLGKWTVGDAFLRRDDLSPKGPFGSSLLARNFANKRYVFIPRDSLSLWQRKWNGRMTNRSSTIKEGICRRSVLKSVPVIAGGIISTKVVARNLFVQAKLTHEVAKYQDHPNNGQQCSGCVQFVAPASCKLVEDPIAASGWCQLFMPKPA